MFTRTQPILKAGRFVVGVAMLMLLHQAPAPATTVTLQAAKDNSLYEDGTGALSNGKGQHLFAGRVGPTGGSLKRRALLQFDVAGQIPAGSTIQSVQLKLNMSLTVALAQTVSLHRVSADWGEGTSDAITEEGTGAASTTNDATWVHRFFNATPWTTVGGDFTVSPSGSASVNAVGSYSWGSTSQMVADVQAWLNTPASNFGWILIGNEAVATTAKRFDSREHPVTANRPQLIIGYTPPPIANNIVWPAGKQTFENMQAGDDVTRITAWTTVGAGPDFTVLAAKGTARPGTTSTTWLRVVDNDPATSSRFYSAFVTAPTSPTAYTWTSFVNLETTPPLSPNVRPKITVQHQSPGGPLTLWGVELRDTGAFLVALNPSNEAVTTAAQLYPLSGATGLNQWVKLTMTVDFTRGRIFGAANNNSPVSVPISFPAGASKNVFRYCYRGNGTGNVMRLLIDDVAVSDQRTVPVELSAFKIE